MPPDDFFDGEWEEPSRTQETAPTSPAGEEGRSPDRPARPPRERSRGRSSGKRPSLSRPAGMPSLEGLEWGRLGMLAAGIVVVVLVLLLLTQACSGSSATSKNQAYFNEVKTVLGKSDAAGAQLHDLLNSQQPVKLKQVQSRLTTDAWRGPVRGDRGHQPQAHQAGGIAAAVAAADAVLSRERARLHDQRDAAGLPREAGARRRQAAGALHAADARLRHHLHRLLLDAGDAPPCTRTASTSRCRRRCSSTSPTRRR